MLGALAARAARARARRPRRMPWSTSKSAISRSVRTPFATSSRSIDADQRVLPRAARSAGRRARRGRRAWRRTAAAGSVSAARPREADRARVPALRLPRPARGRRARGRSPGTPRAPRGTPLRPGRSGRAIKQSLPSCACAHAVGSGWPPAASSGEAHRLDCAASGRRAARARTRCARTRRRSGFNRAIRSNARNAAS